MKLKLVKIEGVYENVAKRHESFSFESSKGMTIELSGGDSQICKIECSCQPGTVATRITVWGNMTVEVGNNLLEGNEVVIRRV